MFNIFVLYDHTYILIGKLELYRIVTTLFNKFIQIHFIQINFIWINFILRNLKTTFTYK